MTILELIQEHLKRDQIPTLIVARRNAHDLVLYTKDRKYIYTGDLDKDNWVLTTTAPLDYEEGS